MNKTQKIKQLKLENKNLQKNLDLSREQITLNQKHIDFLIQTLTEIQDLMGKNINWFLIKELIENKKKSYYLNRDINNQILNNL